MPMSPEQMVQWRSSVDSTAAVPQTAGTTFSTTGVGTFNQPDPFMFGYSFINEPVMTYGCQLDNYDPSNAQAVVSQGYSYGWIMDDQGMYIGVYIGARIIDMAAGAQATHHFHFREIAVKNALTTPNVPATYAIGTYTNPAAADGTLLNISAVNMTPTVAPTSSPNIAAYGLPSSIVLKSDIIDPNTEIEYHVNTTSFTPVQGDPTTLVKTTRSMVEVVSALPSGALLQLNTTYYFHAIAVNAAGHATPSPEVTCQLDPTAVQAVVAAQIVAGFILAGTIQVGNITVDPNNGIQIPLANGGLISLPANGSSAQFIRVLLEATSLLVDDNFELRGTLSKLAGTLTMSVGVTTPTVAPTVTASWADPSVKITTMPAITDAGSWYGLVDDGTRWISCDNGNDRRVYGIDKTTGAKTTLATLPSGDYPSGVTKIGTSYYVLGQSVYIYDSTWTLTSSWTVPAVANSGATAIASDGSSTVYLAYTRSGTDGKILVYSFTTSGGSQTLLMTTPTSFGGDAVSLFVGTADFGATRYVLGPSSSTFRVYSGGSPATEQTSQNWAVADSGLAWGGIEWDGTNFYSVSKNGVWKYSPVVTATARSVRFSYYDNNATGGTHETAWSPAASFTQNPRQWMRVSTPAPANNGGTDDPDAIRHYVQTGGSGSYWLQPDITATPWVAYYGAPATSGTSAVSTPDFSGVGSPGLFQSGAVDGSSNPLTDLRGDGSFRIKGSNLSETSFTPGWLNGGGGGSLSIGNGTLVGSKRRVGDMMSFEVVLTRGSTTNFGSTYYVFTAGETFVDYLRVHGEGFVRQNSSGTSYPVQVYAIDNQSVVCVLSSGTTRVASGGAPVTWATGDVISFSFRARVST